jgi:hypothetical protein
VLARRDALDAHSQIAEAPGRRCGGIEVPGPIGEIMRGSRDVKVTLGVGIVLIAAGGAVTLTHAPPSVARPGVPAQSLRPLTVNAAEVCQANETIPSGVSAIRVSLGAYFGPRVRVTAYSGSRVLTTGTRGPGWSGNSVTVSVAPLSKSASAVRLCIDAAPNSELIYLGGIATSTQESAIWHGAAIGGRVGVEYLASGRRSWWSRILSVERHMGIGHALSGTWVVLLIAVLLAAAGGLAVYVALQESP